MVRLLENCIKNKIIILSSNSNFEYIPQTIESRVWKRYLHTNAHSDRVGRQVEMSRRRNLARVRKPLAAAIWVKIRQLPSRTLGLQIPLNQRAMLSQRRGEPILFVRTIKTLLAQQDSRFSHTIKGCFLIPHTKSRGCSYTCP